MSVFSEHAWDSWKFSTRNFGMQDQVSILERFVQKLTRELHVEKLEDWYNVSSQVVQDLGVSGSFLKRNGDLPGILKKVYPQHHWQKDKFSRVLSKRALQRSLEATVSKIYPSEGIMTDYFYPELAWANLQPLQLDIYVPTYKIAFEFQGIQHYDTSLFAGKVKKSGERKEESKKEVCKSVGITLVEVPYWWDGTKDSLFKIIDNCKDM